MGNKPRELITEEVRENFLNHVRDMVEYWNNVDEEYKAFDISQGNNYYPENINDKNIKSNISGLLHDHFLKGENNMKLAEVKNDFYDEEDKCISIDAWRTGSGDEEGFVVAKVYADKVEVIKPNAMSNQKVIEAIEEAKNEIKNIIKENDKVVNSDEEFVAIEVKLKKKHIGELVEFLKTLE